MILKIPHFSCFHDCIDYFNDISFIILIIIIILLFLLFIIIIIIFGKAKDKVKKV